MTPTRLLLLALCSACLAAADPLKVWSPDDLSINGVWGAEPGMITRQTSVDVKTPEGEPTLEVQVKRSATRKGAHDAQLAFYYRNGIKAGQTYEVSFACRGSVAGTMQVQAALEGKPWTQVAGALAKVAVTGTGWQQVTLRFTADQDIAAVLAMPRILLGGYGADATLHLGPVRLVAVAGK